MSINRGAGDNCGVWETVQKKVQFESPCKTAAATFKIPAIKIPVTPRIARSSRSQCRLYPSKTEKIIRKPSTSPCSLKNRRAISLENLTPRESPRKLHIQSVSRNRQQQQELLPTEGNVKETYFDVRSAKRICQVLILNAWRKERERVKALARENAVTIKQVDGYKKDSIALRKLLDVENDRMSKATSNIHELSEILDKNSAKIDEIYQQKDDLESKLVDCEIKTVKLETSNESEMENYRETKAFLDDQELTLLQEHKFIEELKNGIQLTTDTIANDNRTITMNKETIQNNTKKIAEIEIELLRVKQNIAAHNAKQEEKQDRKLKLRNGNARMKYELEESLSKRDILLQQIKLSKLTLEEKETYVAELERAVDEKEHAFMLLRQQLYEFELQESGHSWTNQARHLASLIRPLVAYILTQRVY